MSDHKKRNIWLIVLALIAVLAITLAVLRPGGTPQSGDGTPQGGDGTQNDPDVSAQDPDGSDADLSQPGPDDQPSDSQTGNSAQTPKPPAGGSESVDPLAEKGLRCTNFSLFSGQFVEDGRDELVEDVAAVLVTNTTDQFLDFGVLIYELDGETCTFVVTGLPAGESAWVMETLAITASHDSELVYEDCVTSFRAENTTSAEGLTITSEGNTLTVTNQDTKTRKDVYIYYKNRHSDGNFFGGITYRVSLGDLSPGASVDKLAGHYAEGTSEIVRVSWQE